MALTQLPFVLFFEMIFFLHLDVEADTAINPVAAPAPAPSPTVTTTATPQHAPPQPPQPLPLRHGHVAEQRSKKKSTEVNEKK
jgi:hypothetical protein